MSTPTFTPGPWERQSEQEGEDGIAIIGLPTSGLIAWATLHPTERDQGDFSRAEANARLIAASPTMFETLELVAEVLTEMQTHDGANPMRFHLAVRRVSEALAKAEGRE